MDWKLISLLSLFGVVMGFAAVFGVTGKYEPIFWLVIFVFYGMTFVRRTGGRYFLHAFLTSTVNGVWIGLIHAAFFQTYAANNPDFAGAYERMPHILNAPVTIICFGPMFGAIFGLFAGLVAWICGKVMKHPTVQDSSVHEDA